MDARVGRIAARQRGNVTRAQVRALGIARSTIVRALRDGRWREPFARVYFVGAGELTPPSRAQAALLACPAGSVLSHRSAGALWGILDVWPEQPDVTVANRNVHAPRGTRLHRVRALPDTHVTTRLGLRVTTPERTLLDLAECLDARDLRRAAGQAEYRKLLNTARLRRTLTEARGRHGIRPLRDVVPGLAPAPTASHLEDRFHDLLRRAALPAPEVNARLGRYKPDFLWPEQRVVVETDGWAAHGGPIARERDAIRDADLQIAGYRIMRVSAHRLRTEPWAVIAQLAVLLAS